MKKNLLFTALAATTLLFATSCQQDEVFVDGNESIVTFEVGTPQMATRAYSDGLSATQLKYAVYDENHERIDRIPETTTTINGSTRVEMQLAAGKTYNVLFWAANENAPYSVDFVNQTMSIDYDAETLSNDERRDAFYCYHKVQVDKANKTETVKLRRPFAQLNIGTNDLNKLDGVSAEFTQVTVPVYSTLNLATGIVEGTATKQTFAFAARPASETFPVADYDYLAMNYLLVGKDKAVVDVTFSYDAAANATAKPEYTRTYTGIPVQANYRTNIYGSLLTQGIDFEVEINPDFDLPNSDVTVNPDGSVVVTVANDIDLQKAIDNATGNTTIIFKQDITAPATRAASGVEIIVRQKEGVNLTIDGDQYKFDGVFDIYGNARNNGAETLTFTNINFIHTSGSIDFITCNTTDAEKRYAHNVTVEGCTFTGNDNGDVVGMRYRQCYNLSVKNTTATNMHSLMWTTGSTNLEFDNVTIEDSKNGISLGTSTNISVKNSDINTEFHALRANGYTSTLNVENTTLTANQPIIVRNLTSGTYTVNLGEGVNLTTDQDYQVVFTNDADDKAYAEPQGQFVITGAEKFRVFPGTDIKIVNNATELQEAINNAVEGKTTNIRFGNDITGNVTVKQTENINIVIDGCNKKYDGSIKIHNGSNYNNAETYIQNVNFVTSQASINCVEAVENGSERYSQNITVDNCTFTANGAAVHTSVGVQVKASKNLTVSNCTATNMHSLLQAQSCDDKITVENVKAIDCKNGISFGNTAYPSITNAEIDVNGYGIRANGDASRGDLKVNNCNIKADLPIVVRKLTTNYAVALAGDNTLAAGNVNGYQITFTKGDDGTFEIPTGTYTLTGAEGFKVYPQVSTAAELQAALETKSAEIVLAPGAIIEGTFKIGYNATIKSANVANSATIKGRVEVINTSATFENIKLDYNDASKQEFSSDVVGNPKGHPAIIGVYGGVDNTVTFEGCEFNFKSGYSIDKAPGAITHYGGTKLIVKDCILDGEGNPIYAKTNIEMTGCTVKMYGNNAVLNLNYDEGVHKVVFTNNTVENKSTNGNKTYGMQFLSTNGKAYKNMYFDVKGNTVDVMYSVGSGYTFENVTYAPGSVEI